MGTTNLNFERTIKAFGKRSIARMEALFQRASLKLFEAIDDRTPKVTGFLASTLGGSLAGIPPIDPNATGEGAPVNVQPYDLMCQTARLGQTVYGGFVAVYARRIEYGFHGTDSLGRTYNQTGRAMVRLSVQRWDEIVGEALKEVKAEIR